MVDWTIVLVGFFAAVPPTIMALAAFVTARRTKGEVQDLNIQVNHRLTQLLESATGEAAARGELKGIEKRDLERDAALAAAEVLRVAREKVMGGDVVADVNIVGQDDVVEVYPSESPPRPRSEPEGD